MIKGINKLTYEQKEILFKVNELHTRAVGNDYRVGMEITEVWIKKGIVCARLKNGYWYHYTKDGTWY